MHTCQISGFGLECVKVQEIFFGLNDFMKNKIFC